MNPSAVACDTSRLSGAASHPGRAPKSSGLGRKVNGLGLKVYRVWDLEFRA